MQLGEVELRRVPILLACVGVVRGLKEDVSEVEGRREGGWRGERVCIVPTFFLTD